MVYGCMCYILLKLSALKLLFQLKETGSIFTLIYIPVALEWFHGLQKAANQCS